MPSIGKAASVKEVASHVMKDVGELTVDREFAADAPSSTRKIASFCSERTPVGVALLCTKKLHSDTNNSNIAQPRNS